MQRALATIMTGLIFAVAVAACGSGQVNSEPAPDSSVSVRSSRPTTGAPPESTLPGGLKEDVQATLDAVDKALADVESELHEADADIQAGEE